MIHAPPLVDVVVPTRNRPAQLERCLVALAAARAEIAFPVHVLDSSDPEWVAHVKRACASFEFVTLHHHDRVGFGAARNACARAGTASLVVTVDDDVYVSPNAVTRLVDRYQTESGWRIVAGSVFWGTDNTGPGRMRRIGYGTPAATEHVAEYYITALMLYPRELVLQFPYHEELAAAEDRFMGALWRSKNVAMLWEPGATARHDDVHTAYAVETYDAHIYVNLFDALIVRRSVLWAGYFQLLGFAAGARSMGLDPGALWRFTVAWGRGNLRFARDMRILWRTARQAIAGTPPEPVIWSDASAGPVPRPPR